jgi:hypothetical protein
MCDSLEGWLGATHQDSRIQDMVSPRRRSTVPVACPSCRHEGPAYLFLLGKLSRCKMCGHDFPMPGHVRIRCPGCGLGLRVPAEMIDRDVSCKFCNQGFRADPTLIAIPKAPTAPAGKGAALDRPEVRAPSPLNHPNGNGLDVLFKPWQRTAPLPTGPGEHAAIAHWHHTPGGIPENPDVPAELQVLRADLARMARDSRRRMQRIRSLERALGEFVGEQRELRAELSQTRTENEVLVRQSRDEIARLRAQLGRLDDVRKAVAMERDRLRRLAQQPQLSPQSPLGRNPTRPQGTACVLTTRPPQHARGVTRSPSRAGGNGAHLGAAFDRLSKCEQLADGLMDQLKTSREEKSSILTDFASILERLQDVLSRVEDDRDVGVDTNRVSLDGADLAEDCGPIVPVFSNTAESLS